MNGASLNPSVPRSRLAGGQARGKGTFTDWALTTRGSILDVECRMCVWNERSQLDGDKKETGGDNPNPSVLRRRLTG